MPCAERLRTQAYFDGELDALAAADCERHAETCAECRALLQEFTQVRTALREMTPVLAPAALRTRIERALDADSGGAAPAPSRRRWRPTAFWGGALGGIGTTALAATLAFFLLGHPLLDELIAAHVRSLMPSHLIDVESTDRHTVKPWFAGHADVSPVVADFTPQGYRLVGGRTDYLNHQRAAVVVYQHGAHVINVFTWSAAHRAWRQNTTRSGYRIACWPAADLQYCAVSDTGWDELQGLVRLLEAAQAQDLPSR